MDYAIGHSRAGIFNQTSIGGSVRRKGERCSPKVCPYVPLVYGVRLPLLNLIVKEHREGGFDLAEALWNSGAFEEKLSNNAKLNENAAINRRGISL